MHSKNMEIIKSYKVRIYPNKIQEEKLIKIIGACRWIWNHYLEEKTKEYMETGRNITYKEMSADLTHLRKQTEWLQEIQHRPLQQSLRNLDGAYNNFFKKHAKLPKFKSKKDSKQSFQKAIKWKLLGNRLQIQKDIILKTRGRLPQSNKLGTLTVFVKDNRWYASMVAYEEIETPKEYSAPIGIDMGLKDLVITSNGERYENMHIQKRKLKKLKLLSQSLDRKVKGGKRRQKAKEEVAKLHCKITNQRQNYLHHVSKAIVSKNHAYIAVEDLAVTNMMKNHKLARGIADVSWSELLRQITYKQNWKGAEVIKVDRFFPSSKMCSICHFVIQSLPLSVRNWTCPRCNTEHDRDINSAKNILQQARLSLGIDSTESKQSAMVV